MKRKYLFLVSIIAAVLLIGSVYLWAQPCRGMLEITAGKSVHMACFYLKTPSLVMALLWIAISADGLRSKRMPSLLWIISGCLTVLMTIESIGGLTICSNPEMSCHTTIWWIRGLGFLVALVGFLSLYDPEKQVE